MLSVKDTACFVNTADSRGDKKGKGKKNPHISRKSRHINCYWRKEKKLILLLGKFKHAITTQSRIVFGIVEDSHHSLCDNSEHGIVCQCTLKYSLSYMKSFIKGDVIANQRDISLVIFMGVETEKKKKGIFCLETHCGFISQEKSGPGRLGTLEIEDVHCSSNSL